MPRRTTPDDRSRWPSKSYASGYVFNRNGTAVMRVKGFKRSTGLRFIVANKAKCIELLDQWIPIVLRGSVSKRSPDDVPSTVLALSNEYATLHSRQLSDEVKKLTELAVRHYFHADCPLDVTAIVRRINQINASGITVQRHYSKKLKKEVVKEVPIARATLRKRLQYIGKLFRWAVHQEYLTTNPVERIELGRAPRRPKPRVFTDEDITRIAEWFDQRDARDRRPKELRLTSYKRYNLLWRFFLYTGCRSNEALTLTWSNVSDTTITFIGKRERVDEPKERGFPIDAFVEVRSLIDELRALRSSRDDRVFHWWETTQGISDALRMAVRELGISGTVKTFRVTAGVRWRRLYGLSSRTIADLRGHTERVADSHYHPEQMSADLFEQVELERSKRRAEKVVSINATKPDNDHEAGEAA